MRLALAALLLLASACSPGPTLVLGRLPDADSDSDEDAGVFEPCHDGDECTSDERPFCSERLERCVVCTRDRHCADDEYCSSRGRCISER